MSASPNTSKRIGIIASGGDCGGLNAVIEGAALAAIARGATAVIIPQRSRRARTWRPFTGRGSENGLLAQTDRFLEERNRSGFRKGTQQ